MIPAFEKSIIKLTKGVRIFIKIFSASLVVFLLFLAVSLFGVRLFGVQVYTVLSGSMEPSYPVGSVIYVKDADPDTLWVGDVVTFESDADLIVTHRIVSAEAAADDPNTVYFRTKGDANTDADAELLTQDRILGKPFFVIPKIGFVADFMHSASGRWICIVLAALVIFLTILAEYLREPPQKKE